MLLKNGVINYVQNNNMHCAVSQRMVFTQQKISQKSFQK